MVKRVAAVACLVALAWVDAAADEIAPLTLTRVWSVQGPGRFDASGLMIRDGRFYAVSDRHSDTIFTLELEGEVARAVPSITFTGPEPYPERGYMDLEGIAAAPDGGFYLAPEWGFAVCYVPAGGGKARWVTPDLRPAAQAVGLFATKDAYLEGLAVLDPEHLVLACERQPRGMLEACKTGGTWAIHAELMDTSRYPLSKGRSIDWSDLAVWQGRLFGLARNQHLVVELVRAGDEPGRWSEGGAWSFAAVENAPEHAYTSMTYGQAEGLAITDETIYVLIDNNAMERVAQPGDRRGWLFAFSNPWHKP